MVKCGSMNSDLLQQLSEKSISKEELIKAVEDDFNLLPLVIQGVSSNNPRVRYGCAGALATLSEKHPADLYPHMDFFVNLLDNKRRILVWNAIAALANLCAVDIHKKFDAVFNKYYVLLMDEYMVTVANVVGNSARIANAKPYLVPKITGKLLEVERIRISPHLTEECKRVITQQAIDSFDQFFDLMSADEKAKVIYFVKKHSESPRESLKKKANSFLVRRLAT